MNEKPIFETVEGSPVSEAPADVILYFRQNLAKDEFVISSLKMIGSVSGFTPDAVARIWGNNMLNYNMFNFPDNHINMKVARALAQGQLNNEIAALMGTG